MFGKDLTTLTTRLMKRNHSMEDIGGMSWSAGGIKHKTLDTLALSPAQANPFQQIVQGRPPGASILNQVPVAAHTQQGVGAGIFGGNGLW